MRPEPPLFISRLDPHIAPRLHRLRRQDAGDFSAADKREATALLADALHGILDTVFTRLIDDIDRSYGEPGPHSRAIKAAEHTINDVKYKGTSDQFIREICCAQNRALRGARCRQWPQPLSNRATK